MRRDGNSVSYTDEERQGMIARGKSKTDWARLEAMTDEEIEAAVDLEEEGVPDWSSLTTELPLPKQMLTLRLDPQVVAWFKAQGPGYQTRMNAVLRHEVEAQKRSA